jgi:hypothetical protein
VAAPEQHARGGAAARIVCTHAIGYIQALVNTVPALS